MRNIYPNEKRATTLKRCRDLDTKIRKKLVEHKIKGRTTSNARVYMPKQKGGLGLRAIELEAEMQYLQMHSDMGAALKTYQALKRAGWRVDTHRGAGEIQQDHGKIGSQPERNASFEEQV